MTGPHRVVAALAGVFAVAGLAAAQQPGFRPNVQVGGNVGTISPPITNPTVLRAITPVPTAFLPGYYTPPAVVPNPYNPWSPAILPGSYVPPRVVRQLSGSYLPLPNGTGYNPTTGLTYSPWFNQYSGADGVYRYDPWTGGYTNPLTGETYDPTTRTMTRPTFGPVYTPGVWGGYPYR